MVYIEMFALFRRGFLDLDLGSVLQAISQFGTYRLQVSGVGDSNYYNARYF